MHRLQTKFNFLPTQCLRCKCMQVSHVNNICDPCYLELPRILSCCRLCGIPTSISVAACGRCLNSTYFIDQSCIPCTYISPVDAWLRGLKDRRRLEVLPVLSQLLIESIHTATLNGVDLIIPIPMHWSRRLIRGYNQAELLASSLSKMMVIPTAQNILMRSRRVKSQRTLSRSQRIRNQKNSFCVVNAEPLKAKRVLLVDDIVTTGATASRAAAALKHAGAETVFLAAVARTPEPADF